MVDNVNLGPGPDNYVGSSSAERINTGLGVDTVDAGGGDDVVISVDADGVLDGGAGIDQIRILRGDSSLAYNIDLRTGSDADIGDGTTLLNFERLWFVGGSGDDVIYSGDNNDFLMGGAGADYLSAGGGSDLIVGGAGDTILAGAGFDRIYLSSAPVFVDGGADNDIITVTADFKFGAGSVVNVENFEVVDGVDANLSNLTQGTRIKVVEQSTVGSHLYEDGVVPTNGSGSRILATQGNDTVIGGNGNDELYGGSGNDVLYGGKGNDTLVGGKGSDRLFGGEGDDSLFSHEGQGPDTLDGGDGFDYAKIDRGDASVAFNFDIEKAGAQDIGDGTIISSIERINFQGGSANDTGYGSTGNDVFEGNDGDDYFDGRGGIDLFSGGAGNDTFIGGDGTSDRAAYNSNYSDADYQVTKVGNVYTVVSAAFGTDTYIGVELIRFNDGYRLIDSLLD